MWQELSSFHGCVANIPLASRDKRLHYIEAISKSKSHAKLWLLRKPSGIAGAARETLISPFFLTVDVCSVIRIRTSTRLHELPLPLTTRSVVHCLSSWQFQYAVCLSSTTSRSVAERCTYHSLFWDRVQGHLLVEEVETIITVLDRHKWRHFEYIFTYSGIGKTNLWLLSLALETIDNSSFWCDILKSVIV